MNATDQAKQVTLIEVLAELLDQAHKKTFLADPEQYARDNNKQPIDPTAPEAVVWSTTGYLLNMQLGWDLSDEAINVCLNMINSIAEYKFGRNVQRLGSRMMTLEVLKYAIARARGRLERNVA